MAAGYYYSDTDTSTTADLCIHYCKYNHSIFITKNGASTASDYGLSYWTNDISPIIANKPKIIIHYLFFITDIVFKDGPYLFFGKVFKSPDALMIRAPPEFY